MSASFLSVSIRISRIPCDICLTRRLPAHSTSRLARRRVRNGTARRFIGTWFNPAPEWGGGEVWFGGELIRKDGLFVRRI
jgi:hypothetical protein